MIEWNIQSRAHTCQACSRGFRPHEAFHTLLFSERSGYVRTDVCEDCWQAQHAEAANHRKGFVSHWLGTFEPPPTTPPEAIQKDTAESLLRKLVELGDPQHAGAVFILAVMLERKRLLKVKAQTVEEGRRVLVYEHSRSGDVFTIPDPALQLDQLELVQRDVANLLEHGLNPVVEPAPAAPADGPAPDATDAGRPTGPDPESAANPTAT